MRLEVNNYQQQSEDHASNWRAALVNTFAHNAANVRVECANGFDCNMITNRMLRTQLTLAKGSPHHVKLDCSQYNGPSYLALAINLHGETEIVQNGKRLLLKSLDTAFLDHSTPYEIQHNTEFELLTVVMPQNALGVFQHRLNDLTDYTYSLSDEKYSVYIALMRELISRSEAIAPEEMSLCFNTARVMFNKLLFGMERSQSLSNLSFVKLEMIDELIDKNIDDVELDREKAARLLGYSVRDLNRTLSQVNSSLTQRIKSKRMRYASKLLADPSLSYLSITDIAASCGYSHLSTFCRVFQNHFGLSPRDFRRKEMPD
jgi:AraC-like DNA-binding protein